MRQTRENSELHLFEVFMMEETVSNYKVKGKRGNREGKVKRENILIQWNGVSQDEKKNAIQDHKQDWL